MTLSFNVHEKEPRGDYVLDVASRHGFRSVRLSLSLPVFKAANTFLPLEELHEVAPWILRFCDAAEERGIAVQLDNAVPLCMFTEQQAGRLVLRGVLELRRNMRCEPVIDIGPDLNVWSCSCLSQLANRNLAAFRSLADAKDYFSGVWNVYQGAVYPMQKCWQCAHRERWGCQGGCLSYAIATDGGRRYDRPPSEQERAPLPSPERGIALADAVTLVRYDLPCESYLPSSSDTGG